MDLGVIGQNVHVQTIENRGLGFVLMNHVH